MTKTLQDYKDILKVGDEVEIDDIWWSVEDIGDNSVSLRDGRYSHFQSYRTEITGYRPKKRTLETLEVGDYVEVDNGYIRRILMAQGEGEYRTYNLSNFHDRTHEDSLSTCRELKQPLSFKTAFELEEEGYTPYTPDEETTLTMDEVAKKFGVDVNKLRIKKNDD